jgi:hypothetical protein
MLTLPIEFTNLILAFAPLFSQRVFQSVQVLVVGAILAPGKRTVTAILRVMGLSQEKHFQNYHRLFVVADSSFAALELLAAVSQITNPVHMITRLRLDAVLYEPASPRKPRQMGRPRLKGKRLPNLCTLLTNPQTQWQSLIVNGWYGGGQRVVELVTGTAVWYHTGMPPVSIRWVLVRDPEGKFDTQALLCTNQEIAPLQILEWFVRRWQLEVTFQEVRTHLGVETQRQWSDLAIARTTPTLLGLFSLVTLLAHRLQHQQQFSIRQAAWYAKPLPTFVDAVAVVRHYLWPCTFSMSHSPTEMVKIPRVVLERLTDTYAYAA